MKIAVIGGGISGLACAWELERQFAATGQVQHQVSLFEAGSHFGGHSNTIDVTLGAPGAEVTAGVDTGFLVFNKRTYPLLTRLFDELGVAIAPSDMSFSVALPEEGLEWAGTNLNTLFGQRRNLANPRFLRMVTDIVRFNRLATHLVQTNRLPDEPLAAFLRRHRLSDAFRDWYLLPMAACIWSCPPQRMLDFPVSTMLRFCHNHGLLQVTDRPQWYTVRGGSREYVKRLVAGLRDARREAVLRVDRAPSSPESTGSVTVHTASGASLFDEVVFACHSDQAFALLQTPTMADRLLLKSVGYQRNRAVLHTDRSLLPASRRVWSAWNYTRVANPPSGAGAQVCVHYLINQLQPLPPEWGDTPVVVSLNPVRDPDPRHVLAEIDYAHPVFDEAAIIAQRSLPLLQGRRHTWYCGAWTGYGFHEDGLRSGLQVAQGILERSRSRALEEAA